MLHRLQIVVLRRTPLSWATKRRLIWYLLPRFAIGVQALIQNRAGNVLVLRSAYSGQWQLPGGNLEHHETPAAAIVREIVEETGYRPAGVRLLGVIDDPSGRGLHLVYLAEPAPKTVRLSIEHCEWRYLAPDELRGLYRRCVDLLRDSSEGAV